MQPINFEGSNRHLLKPDDVDEKLCQECDAFHGEDVDGFPFYLTAWQPSYEDVQAINNGQPVWVKIIGKVAPMHIIFTTDEFNKPNYE